MCGPQFHFSVTAKHVPGKENDIADALSRFNMQVFRQLAPQAPLHPVVIPPWKSNSENICKKITAGICAIRRVKPFVDKDTLISIYNAIVRPYFDYCCEVWDVFGESQSKRLQKLQNRAARIILNMSNDISLLYVHWAGSHSKQKGRKLRQK